MMDRMGGTKCCGNVDEQDRADAEQRHLNQTLQFLLPRIARKKDSLVQIKGGFPPHVFIKPISAMVEQHLQGSGAALQQGQVHRQVSIGIVHFQG
jgi:hypothetical protein